MNRRKVTNRQQDWAYGLPPKVEKAHLIANILPQECVGRGYGLLRRRCRLDMEGGWSGTNSGIQIGDLTENSPGANERVKPQGLKNRSVAVLIQKPRHDEFMEAPYPPAEDQPG